MNNATGLHDAPYSPVMAMLPHSDPMEPRKFLQALMDRAGDNSNSLAVKLRFEVKQPQIYKFLHGQVREPKRSNIEPIAAHYKVPVDAFYDPELAEIEYAKLIGAVPPPYTASYLGNKPYVPPVPQPQWNRQADTPDEEPPEMDARTRRVLIEGMVEDQLISALPREWEPMRERNRWSDMSLLGPDLEPRCDLEIRTLRIRRRQADLTQLHAFIGRLWQKAKRSAGTHHLPTAMVVVLINDENQFEVGSDLFRTLDECVEGELLQHYTVVALEVTGFHANLVPVQTSYTWPSRSESIADMVKAITST
jgi:hypothetical protein